MARKDVTFKINTTHGTDAAEITLVELGGLKGMELALDLTNTYGELFGKLAAMAGEDVQVKLIVASEFLSKLSFKQVSEFVSQIIVKGSIRTQSNGFQPLSMALLDDYLTGHFASFLKIAARGLEMLFTPFLDDLFGQTFSLKIHDAIRAVKETVSQAFTQSELQKTPETTAGSTG